ncbi:hypothetical protein E5288_WYG013740 [Bos mutus]|uniref:Uncharacterized protein n=1 Tax=Bos mutus TaxID=72004 RepID=A0A6B0QQD3_9CETA|nr:hypothetical protein [Bos mutus]
MVFRVLFWTSIPTLRMAEPRLDSLEGWTNSPGMATGSDFGATDDNDRFSAAVTWRRGLWRLVKLADLRPLGLDPLGPPPATWWPCNRAAVEGIWLSQPLSPYCDHLVKAHDPCAKTSASNTETVLDPAWKCKTRHGNFIFIARNQNLCGFAPKLLPEKKTPKLQEKKPLNK